MVAAELLGGQVTVEVERDSALRAYDLHIANRDRQGNAKQQLVVSCTDAGNILVLHHTDYLEECNANTNV